MTETNIKRNNMHEAYPIEASKRDNVAYFDDDILFVDNIKKMHKHGAFKTPTNTIVICVNGSVRFQINGRAVTVGKNELLICPPQTIIDDAEASVDNECKILCMTDRIMQSFLRSHINVWNEAVYVNRQLVSRLDDKASTFFVKFYEIANMCLAGDKSSRYMRDILKSLLQAGILGLCHILEKSMSTAPVVTARSHTESTFRRFLQMLTDEGTCRRSVVYYAQKLYITPKYLSMICSKHSGKTAKEWINDFLTEKLHYLLKSTDMPIKAVSEVMGFPTVSSMGRFTRAHLGMAPLAYRNCDDIE